MSVLYLVIAVYLRFIPCRKAIFFEKGIDFYKMMCYTMICKNNEY